MATRPTEEELGLGPTPEEQAALSSPAPVEDDVPITQDDEGDDTSMHQVAPQPDKPARAKDPLTGKFVAKGTETVPEGDPTKPAPVVQLSVTGES
jgi:hypothetical protein